MESTALTQMVAELEYFDTEIQELRHLTLSTVFQRRAGKPMQDPVIEIEEINVEVEGLESNLKRSIQVASFLMDKNKELIKENERLMIYAKQADFERVQVLSQKHNTDELIKEKDLTIQDLTNQNQDFMTRCADLENQAMIFKEQLEDERETLLETLDRNLKQLSPVEVKLSQHRKMTGMLQQESDRKVKELEQLVALNRDKFQAEQDQVKSLNQDLNRSKEVIHVLNFKINQYKEKICGQKVLIAELENVIEELTDTLTRDILIQQQRADAPSISKIISKGDSFNAKSIDSLGDGSPGIRNRLRVNVNIGDYRGKEKRTKSAEKSESADIQLVNRPRGNSITYECDYLVEDHHVEELPNLGSNFKANENEMLLGSQLTRDNHQTVRSVQFHEEASYGECQLGDFQSQESRNSGMEQPLAEILIEELDGDQTFEQGKPRQSMFEKEPVQCDPNLQSAQPEAIEESVVFMDKLNLPFENIRPSSRPISTRLDEVRSNRISKSLQNVGLGLKKQRLEEAYQKVEFLNNSQEIQSPSNPGHFEFSDEKSKDVFDFDDDVLNERDEITLRKNQKSPGIKKISPNKKTSFQIIEEEGEESLEGDADNITDKLFQSTAARTRDSEKKNLVIQRSPLKIALQIVDPEEFNNTKFQTNRQVKTPQHISPGQLKVDLAKRMVSQTIIENRTDDSGLPSPLNQRGGAFGASVLRPGRERAAPKRKEPNEEFFKMSLLAFQLNNQQAGVVYTVDQDKLYQEVQKIKRPFYQWPQWIEETMRRKMFLEKYGNRAVPRSVQIQEASREVKVLIVEPIKFREEFF